MPIKLLKFLLFSFICIACSSNLNKKPPKYLLLSRTIIKDTSIELKKEYDFNLIGFGGELQYDVKKISMSFNSDMELTLEEARELIVYCVQLVIDKVN